MAIEAVVETAICSKCGLKYGKRKGYFPPSFSELHKGTGTIHICRTCLDDLFNKYLAECEDTACAARQVCRKLDIYWSKQIFNSIIRETSTRTVMSCYLSKAKQPQYVGKSYDDTLREEGLLWSFMEVPEEPEPEPEDVINLEIEPEPEPVLETEEIPEPIEISEQTKMFFGPGYTPEMYQELEQRYEYWMSEFPNNYEFDIGTKALIKQICFLELDINRDRMEGKSVDKLVNSLNTLLGSANLKPTQRKTDADAESELMNTPLGVWLWKYENKRPLPEVDKDLQDVNKIKKYVFTWMGHVAKMLGLKNTYTRLYEEEVERLRVEKPEYVDEDDETLLIDSYSEDGGDTS